MDYTPITSRRVLLGISLTAFLAFLPLLVLFLQSDSFPPSFVHDATGASRTLLLGAGSVVLALVLVGSVVSMIVSGLRLVRRPSRA